MSLEITKSIDSLVEELNAIQKRASEIKKVINQLCALKGDPPIYLDADYTPAGGNTSILPDQFFGKGLSTAVKEYLRLKGRATIVQEIYDALKKGGFEFPNNWKEKEQLKNLAISLSKNRYDFVIVPGLESNAYGLWEFYPEKKKEKEKGKVADKLIDEKLKENEKKEE